MSLVFVMHTGLGQPRSNSLIPPRYRSAQGSRRQNILCWVHGIEGSSSFDEPLASAQSAGLDYPHPSRTITQILPKGVPSFRPKSFRNSVLIRKMATSDVSARALATFDAKSAKSTHHALVRDLDEDEVLLKPNNRLGFVAMGQAISCPFYQSIAVLCDEQTE